MPSQTLAAPDPHRHPRRMFSISDKDIAAIQAASERGGEWSAMVEVRRLFPGIPNNAEALRVAMIIAGWKPIPAKPRDQKRPRNS